MTQARSVYLFWWVFFFVLSQFRTQQCEHFQYSHQNTNDPSLGQGHFLLKGVLTAKKKKTGLFFQTPPQKPKPRLSIKLVWYANSKHSAMAWYLWCKSSTTLKEISANEGLLTRKVLWNVNSIYVFCSTSRKRDEAYKMKMNTSHYLSTAVVIRGHHRTSSASFKTH